MNTNSSQTTFGNNLVILVLAVAALALVYVVATGGNLTLPIISTDRAALIVLTIVGVAMCAVGGIGPSVSKYGWSGPVTVIGSIVGVLTFLIVLAVILGVQLPLIANERAAFILVTGVIIGKLLFNAAVWLFSRGNVA
jgi:hypothetical protein